MQSKTLQLLLLASLVGVMVSQTCPDGKWRDANNLCQPCGSNCATCDSEKYCTTCISNTFLVEKTNSITCEPCTKVLHGCSICLSNIACQTCQYGFVLGATGKCESCSSKIANCSNCSADGNTCNQCRYPYILEGNKCVSSTVQEITAGVQTVYVKQNDGSSAPFVTLDDGSQVKAVLSAQGCNQYQVYWNGKCIRSIYKCLQYEDGGLCKKCDGIWRRTIFGDCSLTNYVLRCEDGYWKDAANDRCVKVDISCDWYYPNNGSCYNCSTHYTMDSNKQCVPKRACTSREFYSNGKCIEVPLACLAFLADGTCTKCSAGNSLVDGICTPSITVVRAWNDCVFPCSTCFFGKLDYCFSCRFGYHLKDHRYGTCVPIV